MGGTDDSDPRDELSKWIDEQRADISKFQAELQKDLSSWADSTSSSSSSSSTNKGPFGRFKSFIDDNLSTIYTGFKHFPNNIAELKARMQEERAAREAEERDICYRWTGSEDSPDHIRMSIDRATFDERMEAKASVEMLLDQAARKNSHVPLEKLRALYVDHESNPGALDMFANPMLSFGGACYYKEESVDNLPSTARWGCPAPKPRWLSVDWFKRSPYSPVRLEAHSENVDDGLGHLWRGAFEDLLCATLDKQMVSVDEHFGQRYPHGKLQSSQFGPGLEWMLSLQCRGILPPQLPSLYRTEYRGKYHEGGILNVLGRWPFSEPRWRDRCDVHPSDMHGLIDEVCIKSGPNTLWRRPRDALYYEQMRQVRDGLEQGIEARYREEIQQSTSREEEGCPFMMPWSVPETEEELYDQFPPNVPPSEMPKAVQQPQHSAEAAQAEYAEDDDEDDEEEEEEEWDVQTGDMYGYVTEAEEHARALDLLRRMAEKAAEEERTRTQTEEVESELAKKHARRSLDQDMAASTAKPAPNATRQHSAILSQLTTTQTTRSPDGSVTTKVVLKQRFADGTEQEHESVHTSHERVSKAGNDQQAKEAETKDKKKGWFWR